MRFAKFIWCAAIAVVIGWGAQCRAEMTGDGERTLKLRVKAAGFGDVSERDIRAVLKSAGGEIWRYCPHTRFQQPGFEIYHNKKSPITHVDLSPDGRIVIGLAVEGRLWARFAFQFAHEFTHALMDHSNDEGKLWRDVDQANQWLDESICETASLFALRAMSETWKSRPPFPNWRSYASDLAKYAQDRIDDPKHQLPARRTFRVWFAAEQASLRKDPEQRDKNTIVAKQLLPLFEAEPTGWEAVTFLKRGTRNVNQSLAKHLAEWYANAPATQHGFIIRFAAVFGIALPTIGR